MRALETLYDAYSSCNLCPRLTDSRTQVVFGEGDPDADLLIVGEAPGYNEDALGRPFIGASGLLLDTFLAYFATKDNARLHKLGAKMARGYQPTDDEADEIRDDLSHEEKIFYTNAVLCRPPENADPSKGELAACRERLEQTVCAVDPLLILAVGKVPVQALLGKAIRITHDRGQLFDIEIPGVTGGIRYPLLVTYHPAYVARTGDFTSKTGPGQLFAADLQKAFALLDEIRTLSRNETKPTRRKWK